jgi:LPXTG-motif cell wall-anchored protein
MDFTQEDPALALQHLASNEVIVAANATLPPGVVPPVVSPPNAPGLPNTGGPDLWLLMAGFVLVFGGGTLVIANQRRRRRS